MATVIFSSSRYVTTASKPAKAHLRIRKASSMQNMCYLDPANSGHDLNSSAHRKKLIHVHNHLCEPGQLVPAAVFAVFVDLQAGPHAGFFQFVSGRLVAGRVVVLTDHEEDRGAFF